MKETYSETCSRTLMRKKCGRAAMAVVVVAHQQQMIEVEEMEIAEDCKEGEGRCKIKR